MSLKISELLMLIFAILLIFTFFFKAIKKHYKIPYLLSATTSAMIGILSRSIFLSIGEDNYSEISNVLFFLFLSITIVSFFFFVQSCTSIKPDVFWTIIIASLFSSTQIFNFLKLSNLLSP